METNELIIGQLVTAWNGKVKQADQLFDKLGPEFSSLEIVPGGNSVIYLIGHLTAVNDQLIEAMNFGERLYPELDELFLTPHETDKIYPSYPELRKKWDILNSVLSKKFNELTSEQWLSRHHYVGEEDFKKEPNRNLLNILISRTLHLANHIGQLLVVKI